MIKERKILASIVFIILILNVSCKSGDDKTGKTKPNQTKALIMQIKGRVLTSKNVKAPLKQWTPVKTRQVIGKGDYLRTRKNSSCSLVLNNGSKIKIIQNSIIYIENISMPKGGIQKSKLKLYVGSIFSKSSKLVGSSEYSITTPTAIAGVRGTEFVVSADEDKTSVSVNKGKVWLKRNIELDAEENKNEQEKEIKKTATQEINLSAGQASDIKKQDNEKIKTAIEKAKKGENIDITDIKKTAVIKPRKVNQKEKKQFVIFEDIRQMPSTEKENYGVLLIFAGPNTDIFINGKHEGKEMLMKIARVGIYNIKITRNGKTIKQVKAEVKSKQKTEIKVADPVFFEPETAEEKRALQKARQRVFPNDKPNTNIDLDNPGKPFKDKKPDTGFKFNKKDVKKETKEALNERAKKLRDNETVKEQREAVKNPEKSNYGSGDDVMNELKKRRNRGKKNGRKTNLRNRLKNRLNKGKNKKNNVFN